MKTPNRLYTGLFWGLIVLNLCSMGYIWFREKRPTGATQPAEIIKKELQLDAEQAAFFQEMVQHHRDSVRLLQGQIRELRQILYQTLNTPNANPAVTDSLLTRIGTIVSVQEKATYRHFRQLRALCRPNQQKTFDALLERLANRPPGAAPGPEGHRPSPGFGPPPPGEGPPPPRP